MATDPRASNPDIILDGPDGERVLVREPQLMISAEERTRTVLPRIVADIALHEVLREVDGEAVKVTAAVDRQGYPIPLFGDAELSPTPEELRVIMGYIDRITRPLGLRSMARKYPTRPAAPAPEPQP